MPSQSPAAAVSPRKSLAGARFAAALALLAASLATPAQAGLTQFDVDFNGVTYPAEFCLGNGTDPVFQDAVRAAPWNIGGNQVHRTMNGQINARFVGVGGYYTPSFADASNIALLRIDSTISYYSYWAQPQWNPAIFLLGAGDCPTSPVEVTPYVPEVTLGSAAGSTVTGPFTVTASFSEDMSGFALGDLEVTNATVGNLVATSSSETYTFDVTPTTDGPVSVGIPAGSAQSVATGTASLASNALSFTADVTRPVLTLDASTDATAGEPFTVTATYSEDVTGFGPADITVTNGSVATFIEVTPASYTFEVAPSGGDAVTVVVEAGAAEDAVGNASIASNVLEVGIDTTPPAVTITGPDVIGARATFTATFSEDVEGMTIDAVEVTNGSADNLVARSPSVYDFDVRPTGEGPLSIAIASSVARDAAGNPNASTVLTVLPDLAGPDVTLTGPDLVTDVFTVTVAFSEPVRAGHYRLSDSFVTNGAIVPDSVVETAGDTGAMTGLTFRVDPQAGTVVAVELPAGTFIDMAGNPSTASNRFTAQSGSPASEFARAEEAIRAIVREEAKRDLNSTIATNRRMTRAARTRFIRTRRNAEAGAPVASRAVPFDVEGDALVEGGSARTAGEFFQQGAAGESGYSRLFFGDFDFQREEDGTTTASLNGRLAWERQVGERTLMGHFIGLDFARSDIEGAFEGDLARRGLSLGGYVVSELRRDLYVDGFLTYGVGRNDLELSDGVLDLDGDYMTRAATIGGSLTGVIDRTSYEIWPELSFSYGRTTIDDPAFTGTAYGQSDDTLSLEAGHVSVASLALRPEFRVPLDGSPVADSRSVFTFAPRGICERVQGAETSEECGGGVELGVSGLSSDTLTAYDARIVHDRIGGDERTALEVNVDFRF